jgi:hypothetical protein
LISTRAGQTARLRGSTGAEQQIPSEVRLAGRQHRPCAPGINPLAQHDGWGAGVTH